RLPSSKSTLLVTPVLGKLQALTQPSLPSVRWLHHLPSDYIALRILANESRVDSRLWEESCSKPQ
ncbi:Hypothetical predicted protein, partial [Podarcis lilfordi]